MTDRLVSRLLETLFIFRRLRRRKMKNGKRGLVLAISHRPTGTGPDGGEKK